MLALTTSRSRTALIFVLVTLLATGGTLAAWYAGVFSATTSRTITIHGSYPFDVANRQKLVGAATHVFVGRVTALAGHQGIPSSNPAHSLPQTQFQVDVLEPIKGTLGNTVIVSQYGGYDQQQPDRVALFEQDPLLIPGVTYLFVTYQNSQTGWQQIIAPGYANIPLKNDQERIQVVNDFKHALTNQVNPFAEPKQ